MKRVKTLDCTLRDGGYCNNWIFGKQNIDKIIGGLSESGVDYIECGYVSLLADNCIDSTKFHDFEQLCGNIPLEKKTTKYLVMINYGELSIDQIPPKRYSNVDGIRVAFHKKDLEKALIFCEEIQGIGYDVFAQPMVTMCYSDEEFIKLIGCVNRMNINAFYIVDSFGMMKQNDVLHYVNLADKNMNQDIMLGFHAHNNLQLAFANAQSIVDLSLKRQIIVDVSIHGMGRGAGNLNAELFLDYLNVVKEGFYNIRVLLNIMDEVISAFYDKNPWGYSLPNYLSATHMIHPNYAYYLSHKRTLTLEAMDELFGLIDSKKKFEYDEQYIEQLYIEFLSQKKNNNSLEDLVNNADVKDILFIAPGASAYVERKKVCSFIEERKPLVISVNFCYPFAKSDYIFVSNMRRFRQLDPSLYPVTIVTSNIETNTTFAKVDYEMLLNNIDAVRDNACLMAMNLFADKGIDTFYIAGLDGYSENIRNYGFEDKSSASGGLYSNFERINNGIQKFLLDFATTQNVCFLTKSIFC